MGTALACATGLLAATAAHAGPVSTATADGLGATEPGETANSRALSDTAASSPSAGPSVRRRLPSSEADKVRTALGLPLRSSQPASAPQVVAPPPVDMDPELKARVKAARNWLSDAIPSLPAGVQFDQGSSPPQESEDVGMRPRPNPASLTGAPATAQSGAALNGTSAAARRDSSAGAQPNIIINVVDLALEMLTHPGVLSVLGLVLVGKLLFFTLRLNVARQDARLRRQARQQGVARLTPSGDGPDGSRDRLRPDRSRHRHRHRHDA